MSKQVCGSSQLACPVNGANNNPLNFLPRRSINLLIHCGLYCNIHPFHHLSTYHLFENLKMCLVTAP